MSASNTPSDDVLFTDRTDFADQWRTLFHSLRERALLLVLALAVGLLGATGYLIKAPKIYEASAVIEVEQGRKRVVNIQDVDPVDLADADYLRTIAESMEGPALMNRVAERLNLARSPEFLPAGAKELSRDEVLKILGKTLQVELRRGTRLIDVHGEHHKPEMAAKLVTALVEEYVRQEMDSRLRDVKLANEFLREEAERLRLRLQKSEESVQNFKETAGTVSVEERQDIVVEKLKEISGALTAASTERIRLETDARQAELVGDNPDALLLIPSIQGDALVLQIKTSIGEQEAVIADLKKRYLEKHPRMIQAIGRLDELKRSLRAAALEAPSRLALAAETAAAREKSLQQALQSQEGAALGLNKQSITYESLKRESDADRALYESVLARLKETSVVSQNLDSSAIRLIEEPLVPEKPTKPKPLIVLLFGVFAGVATGVVLMLLADFLDSSLKTVDQVEAVTGKSVLAGVPLMPNNVAGGAAKGTPLELVIDSEGRAAEAFRSLRAALLVSGDPECARSIIVTSAIPSEGKTFTALNLAATLAEMGAPTVFVDCDLRRASASLSLMGGRGTGVSDYLASGANIENIIRPVAGRANLFAITAGAFVPSAAGMLAQERFGMLLASIKANFEHIVIDTAPVHAVSDTLLIARHVASVVFVIRARKTPRHAIVRAIQLTQKAGGNIRGIALNMLPEKGRDYYHYQSDTYYSQETGRGNKHAQV